MGKTKFKLNYKGVGELLRSEEMQGVINEYGDNVLNRVGGEYKMDQLVEKRCVVRIKPGTPHAYYSNLKHNSLLKALK